GRVAGGDRQGDHRRPVFSVALVEVCAMKRTAILLLALVAQAFRPGDTPKRIVSLIPAVTEMIFAMGEQSRLVGVSNYDRFPPAVEKIDRVGGLLDPNVEKILSLKPDLVVVYNTQEELKARLERAQIPFYS